MMTNDQIIERFQDKFWDKTLSFGCKVYLEQCFEFWCWERFYDWEYIVWDWDMWVFYDSSYLYDIRHFWYWREQTIDERNQYGFVGNNTKIIWHKLTRWRLAQIYFNAEVWDKIMNCDYVITLLEVELKKKGLLWKTIYERVQVKEIKQLLLDFIEQYEA